MAGANGWGGARPGAGRKPRRQKFPNEAMLADSEIAQRLVEYVRIMTQLAMGGIPVVEETYQVPLRAQMQLAMGGIPVVEETYQVPLRAQMQRAAENVEPTEEDEARSEEMVLVKRVVRYTPPDRAAAEYLISRILGAPGLVADADDTEASGSPGLTIHDFLAGKGPRAGKSQTPR